MTQLPMWSYALADGAFLKQARDIIRRYLQDLQSHDDFEDSPAELFIQDCVARLLEHNDSVNFLHHAHNVLDAFSKKFPGYGDANAKFLAELRNMSFQRVVARQEMSNRL